MPARHNLKVDPATDHALLRWIERAHNIDTDKWRHRAANRHGVAFDDVRDSQIIAEMARDGEPIEAFREELLCPAVRLGLLRGARSVRLCAPTGTIVFVYLKAGNIMTVIPDGYRFARSNNGTGAPDGREFGNHSARASRLKVRQLTEIDDRRLASRARHERDLEVA
jgi:hypothetical protein